MVGAVLVKSGKIIGRGWHRRAGEPHAEIEALNHIYKQLRGSEPPDEETARGIIEKLFFSDKRYDLGEVGRYKINKKLELDIYDDQSKPENVLRL